jgi:hypothetical protein
MIVPTNSMSCRNTRAKGISPLAYRFKVSRMAPPDALADGGHEMAFQISIVIWR